MFILCGNIDTVQEVNDLLRPYEALNWLMDAWLVLAVQDVHLVYQWRLQAEQQMREAGKSGLTDEQVSIKIKIQCDDRCSAVEINTNGFFSGVLRNANCTL